MENENALVLREFAIRLRMIRTNKDITMPELAEKIGTVKSSISRYENAKQEPGLNTLISLSNALGVSIDWLAGNGDRNEIEYCHSDEYSHVIRKCIDENITPQKLDKFIDVIKE